MGLDSIVSVQITKGTKTVTQAGFGVALILGVHTRFAEAVREYTSVAGMISDGFLTSDAEYKAAVALMAQEKKPVKFLVGKRIAAVVQDIKWVPTVQNSVAYTVTINGTAHTYNSDVSATATEIVDGLVALINAGAQAALVTASNVADELRIISDEAGTAFSYSSTVNLVPTVTTANHGVVEDIVDVQDERDDWYCLLLTSRVQGDIMNAAAYIETLQKMYIPCTEDAGVLAATTTDVAALLEAKNYDNTGYIFSKDQESYPEAAFAGRLLPTLPGSETWKFKTLIGITADALTPTEEANAKSKNANVYTEIAGIDMTSEGIMVSGEFIDVTRFIHFITARIKEGIFSTLVNVDKIPYTDAGVASIESAIRTVLLLGVRVGGIAADPEFEITSPKVSEVSSVDRAARLLPDVKFNFQLAGAIHKVTVEGTVSV